MTPGEDRPRPAETPHQPAPEPDAPPALIAPGGKVDRDALFDVYERAEDAAGDDEAPITVRFKLQRDLDKRLDKYLVDRIPFLSRTSLQTLIREQAVTVNGRAPKPSTRLRRGDIIIAVLPPPPSNEIPAENIPIDVLFEDDHLIVINKRADIIIHPARGNKSGTLINALSWHFQHHSALGGSLSTVGSEFARPGVVHRLDRHTTGVMVIAKSDTAHWRLGKQFEHRQTSKRYLAVVHGRVEPLADVIDLPLGKDLKVREKYAVRWDTSGGGKPSVTIYHVRELYRDFSLIELDLKTGRTHQIRVHLSHIGYPIVGDDIYGGSRLHIRDLIPPHPPHKSAHNSPHSPPRNFSSHNPASHNPAPEKSALPSHAAASASDLDLDPSAPLMMRYALHAAMLAFRHPITNEPMTFHAPVHADMRLLIELLRAHRLIESPKVAGAVLDLDAIVQQQR